MTPIKAIRTYFEQGSGAAFPITTAEIKALTTEERRELGVLCCKALGVELIEV